MTLPKSVRGWQSTWFYCQNIATLGQSTGLPPFSLDCAQQPSSLKVTAVERVETNMFREIGPVDQLGFNRHGLVGGVSQSTHPAAPGS